MSWTIKILLIIIGVIIFAGILVDIYFLGKSKNYLSTPTTSPIITQKPNSIPQDPNGPYYHKIYAAASKDGLSWQKNNQLLFDHASVPGAVIKNGIIYLYFVDASGDSSDQLSVGISKDLGKSFDKQKITIKDTSLAAIDPDPVLLDDGKIRLYYFTSSVVAGDPAKTSGLHQIMLADSSDGINFEKPSEVFAEENITDPDVFKTAKDWRLFASKGTVLDLAISSDKGITFQKQNDFSWDNGGVSNTININGIPRTFYCGQGGIASATGANIGKLTAESGVRVEESNKIACDPSVIQLPDNSYIMFYKVQELTKK